jgi:hypothetical protein
MKMIKKALFAIGLTFGILFGAVGSAFAYPPLDYIVDKLILCHAGDEAACVYVDRMGGRYGIDRYSDPADFQGE